MQFQASQDTGAAAGAANSPTRIVTEVSPNPTPGTMARSLDPDNIETEFSTLEQAAKVVGALRAKYYAVKEAFHGALSSITDVKRVITPQRLDEEPVVGAGRVVVARNAAGQRVSTMLENTREANRAA